MLVATSPGAPSSGRHGAKPNRVSHVHERTDAKAAAGGNQTRCCDKSSPPEPHLRGLMGLVRCCQFSEKLLYCVWLAGRKKYNRQMPPLMNLL